MMRLYKFGTDVRLSAVEGLAVRLKGISTVGRPRALNLTVLSYVISFDIA